MTEERRAELHAMRAAELEQEAAAARAAEEAQRRHADHLVASELRGAEAGRRWAEETASLAALRWVASRDALDRARQSGEVEARGGERPSEIAPLHEAMRLTGGPVDPTRFVLAVGGFHGESFWIGFADAVLEVLPEVLAVAEGAPPPVPVPPPPPATSGDTTDVVH